MSQASHHQYSPNTGGLSWGVYNSAAEFPPIGDAEIIYIDTSTTPNGQYRWDGTQYVQIGGGAPLTKTWSNLVGSILGKVGS